MEKLINDLNSNTSVTEAWKKIILFKGIQFNETPQSLEQEDKTYVSPLKKAEALAYMLKKPAAIIIYSSNLGT